MNNVIKIKCNERHTIIDECVFQYDKGIVLEISGIADMPSTVIVDFSIGRKSSVSVDGTVSNGKLTVQIPDSIMEYYGRINAYVIFDTDDYERTMYLIQIPCERKEKSLTYVPSVGDAEKCKFLSDDEIKELFEIEEGGDS